jgi:toxin CcdB
MAQFDVFANPVVRSRRAYPYVVVLQADVAQLGRDRAVAPAAPYAMFPAIAGRLTPVVTIEQHDFVLLVTSLTTLPANSLGTTHASLANRREDILAAIDLLILRRLTTWGRLTPARATFANQVSSSILTRFGMPAP